MPEGRGNWAAGTGQGTQAVLRKSVCVCVWGVSNKEQIYPIFWTFVPSVFSKGYPVLAPFCRVRLRGPVGRGGDGGGGLMTCGQAELKPSRAQRRTFDGHRVYVTIRSFCITELAFQDHIFTSWEILLSCLIVLKENECNACYTCAWIAGNKQEWEMATRPGPAPVVNETPEKLHPSLLRSPGVRQDC